MLNSVPTRDHRSNIFGYETRYGHSSEKPDPVFFARVFLLTYFALRFRVLFVISVWQFLGKKWALWWTVTPQKPLWAYERRY